MRMFQRTRTVPPKSQLDSSPYPCPECGSRDTYVHAVNDQFICADCEFRAPESEVAD